jgi:hypothetical protein
MKTGLITTFAGTGEKLPIRVTTEIATWKRSSSPAVAGATETPGARAPSSPAIVAGASPAIDGHQQGSANVRTLILDGA